MLGDQNPYERTFAMANNHNLVESFVAAELLNPRGRIADVVFKSQFGFVDSERTAFANAALVASQNGDALRRERPADHLQAIVFHKRLIAVTVCRARTRNHQRNRPRAVARREIERTVQRAGRSFQLDVWYFAIGAGGFLHRNKIKPADALLVVERKSDDDGRFLEYAGHVDDVPFFDVGQTSWQRFLKFSVRRFVRVPSGLQLLGRQRF